MRSRFILTIVIVATLLMFGKSAVAGLIYKKNVAKNKAVPAKLGEGAAPYASVEINKPPSPKMHDLVKIVIVESSNASVEGKTGINKETSVDASLDKYINFHGVQGISRGVMPEFGGSVEFEMENEAKTSKKSKITAVVKAEVVEVLPNGNLVVEAKKTRKVNDETETITLTGVIDPDDLSLSGMIRSEDVAQLNISYTGRGSVSDSQRRGWLTKVLDMFWPF